MPTSPRSSRRRRRPSTRAAAPEAKRGPLLLKGGEVVAAAVLVGVVFLSVGIALLASGGAGDGAAGANPPEFGATVPEAGAATGDTGAATDDVIATTDVDGGTTDNAQAAAGDEEAIKTVARRSIEVLPAGQWPSLYDSYTSEFQQRCPREEFDQAGVDTATQLGDDLRLLRFKRLESVTIEGSSAEAVIVGEIAGQGEYQIQAGFQKENGGWKIAPLPDTQGCQAFLAS